MFAYEAMLNPASRFGPRTDRADATGVQATTSAAAPQ